MRRAVVVAKMMSLMMPGARREEQQKMATAGRARRREGRAEIRYASLSLLLGRWEEMRDVLRRANCSPKSAEDETGERGHHKCA